VIASPFIVCVWLFSINLWWAHVTEIPEDKRIIVFNSGIWKGLKGIMFFGGQVIPISMVGAKLEWKKAQKNDTKNKTSDAIKRIIPKRMLFSTWMGWCP
jgi:hypothetical protein